MSDNCHCTKALLSRYADRELGADDVRRVDDHVRSCSQCRQALDEYRQLNGFLTAPVPIEPSPYIWQRIRRGVMAARERKPVGILARLRPLLIPLAGAAVLGVVVFTASQLSQSITRAGQEATIQSINPQPEEGSVPVTQESIPVTPDDTLNEQ